MIISKTPYRISFFGGGTDYPSWYTKFGGEVVSTTIDRYLYLTCSELPNFFGNKYRIVYSKIELTNKINNIQHLVVKKLFQKFKFKQGIELHYVGDLPAQSGMGSSSCFIVGCMNLLHNFNNNNISKKQLGLESLNFEQKTLKEIVGSQDQIAAAYGGFNNIKFYKNKKFKVTKVNISEKNKKTLNSRLLLLYTGNQRRAHDIANSYVGGLAKDKIHEMKKLQEFTTKAKNYLKVGSIDDFGDLLNESWHLKKKLGKKISSEFIDNIYEKALKSGSLGGKILGAGGGGFFLFYVNEENLEKFMKTFSNFEIIRFNFENEGSNIIFNNYKNNKLIK
ncbi:hypothetical protein N9O63_03770 [Candidatus Pelagibacter sp.]|nr:hypothetical protein [Candidatus Pelagibacter sp.]